MNRWSESQDEFARSLSKSNTENPQPTVETPTGYTDHLIQMHEGQQFDVYFYDDHVIMIANGSKKYRFTHKEFAMKFETFMSSRKERD